MAKKSAVKYVNLALQGGGSHGAYTWGVLDRLLDEKDIDIEAVSGTSAGAINAVALAHGYATGGREGARAALRELWKRVGKLAEIAATFALGVSSKELQSRF
jgi:NTE family protein